MWRAVLRSMYSSGLNPLTSPAILQSKMVVSKCVIRPTPETPSTMFDHTVSRSFPIGVIKPMPVTATRRPLELDVMLPAYGRQGQITPARSGKTCPSVWTPCPYRHQGRASEQLADLQGELQSQTSRRHLQISPEQLAQLVEAVQDRVPVQSKVGRSFFDRSSNQVGLERFQELSAVAHLGIKEAAEAVRYETFGEAWILGQDEMRDQFVVAVDHAFRAQLAAGLDRLLGLEVRP